MVDWNVVLKELGLCTARAVGSNVPLERGQAPIWPIERGKDMISLLPNSHSS